MSPYASLHPLIPANDVNLLLPEGPRALLVAKLGGAITTYIPARMGQALHNRR